jgi:hypothetical protein
VRVQARYLLGLGLALVALGCELMSHIHADSRWTVLLPGFVVAGIGVGIINPVVASAAVSVVPPERSGMATGSSTTFRQVGFTTGIAGLGAVFLHQIRTDTVSALATTPDGRTVLTHAGTRLSGAISDEGIRGAAAALPGAGLRKALTDAFRVGYTTTLDRLMVIAMAVALVGAVGSLLLVRQRDFVPSLSPEDRLVPALAPPPALAGAATAPTLVAPVPRPRHAHSKRRRRHREQWLRSRAESAHASTDSG